jgi:hypothetical protein
MTGKVLTHEDLMKADGCHCGFINLKDEDLKATVDRIAQLELALRTADGHLDEHSCGACSLPPTADVLSVPHAVRTFTESYMLALAKSERARMDLKTLVKNAEDKVEVLSADIARHSELLQQLEHEVKLLRAEVRKQVHGSKVVFDRDVVDRAQASVRCAHVDSFNRQCIKPGNHIDNHAVL